VQPSTPPKLAHKCSEFAGGAFIAAKLVAARQQSKSISHPSQYVSANRRLIPTDAPARDANGQALVYVYFEEEPGGRSGAHPNDHHDALTSYRVGGIPWVSAEYLLFKTRFGTVGEPNEVICQSQQDRFCLGVRIAIVHTSAARVLQPGFETLGWAYSGGQL
jgi:hypothetical protein